MIKTNIEWTDYTWNPITGCMGPLNKGRCPYCYAHKLASGRLAHRYLANKHVAPFCDEADPFSPRLWDGRLDAPLRVIKASYKALAATAHPDKGGSEEGMKELNDALERIQQERGTARGA